MIVPSENLASSVLLEQEANNKNPKMANMVVVLLDISLNILVVLNVFNVRLKNGIIIE